MPLSNPQLELLQGALDRYSFPSKVWDGDHQTLSGIHEVERFIRRRLHSDDPLEIKAGLASVVCWGWGGTELYKVRTRRILDSLTDQQIEQFIVYRTTFVQGSIRDLRNLGINQLGRMPFGSKVLAFMRINDRVVLDKKITEILFQTDFWRPLAGRTINYLWTISKETAKHYQQWCRICVKGSIQMGIQDRAVDFERAIFQLSQEIEHRDAAVQCINTIIQDLEGG